MTDLQVRAYRGDDAAAVAELINLVAEAGGGSGGHVAAEIEDAVTNEVMDPEVDTRLVTGADGRLVAVAMVSVPPPGGDRTDLVGGVHPEHRGQGLGRELLAWQLERAAARHAEVAPDASWQAQVIAGDADASAVRLFERFGFKVARYFLDMVAPTGPAPAPQRPEGVRIAPYEAARERELHAVHTAVFRELWGYQERSFESWAPLTVHSATFLPELSRTALAGDAIAGYVLAYATDIPGRLYVGHVGTTAEWRRKGVASALLAEVLGAAGRAGYTSASLDTDAENPTSAAGVYAKVGFAIEQRVAAYRRIV